jgi:hypothetical protein
MIHYALRCGRGHEFDGWFAGSAAFEAQCAADQIACPSCGDANVARALMAPSVRRGGPPREKAAVPAAAARHGKEAGGTGEAMDAPGPVPAGPELPAEVVSAMQRLRSAVERHCTYVGPDFADQALAMHRGEMESRAIYGETTDADTERLLDEGVEVGRVPWVPRADS